MRRIAAFGVAAALVGLIPMPATAQADGDVVVVSAISNRADLISDGDVLIEVAVPDGVPAADVTVTAGTRDVTEAFVQTDDEHLLGLVGGLPLGTSTISAVLPDGRGARLEVTNHAVGGPIFAGPQVQPWICETEEFGLEAPIDAACNAPTVFAYVYKSLVTGQFEAYDPEAPPGDVAMTTTDEGVERPYIVRIEKGTLNRGLHQIAVLADPTAEWSAVAPQESWNRKLIYVFGGGTAPNHTQGTPGGVLVDSALSRGFMVATSSINVHGENANDTVSAEGVMMLKERIVESYGPIRYTIGMGSSGGALQQYMIADTYPGLLDGLLPSASFPDIWSTITEVNDCVTFVRYFNETSPELWAVAQQRAFVAGHQEPGSCIFWNELFGPLLRATEAENCALPADQVYDPATNPAGVRCDIPSYQIAIWGRRPASVWGDVETALGQGFARRPMDNIGVQYGLEALEDGTVLPAQFVDLNEKVGGLDIDGVPVPGRVAADPDSVSRAYATGQVLNGVAVADVPIIDQRGHDNTEIHTDVYSHVSGARLIEANGHADNHVIWTGAIPLIGEPEWAFCGQALASALGGGGELPTAPVPCSDTSPLLLMDSWLAAIEADTSTATLADKVLANRPEAAVDACFISGQPVTDEDACNAAFPVFQTTRMTAGGPASNGVIKCALAPLDRESYSATFTDGEWSRLEETFPDGVCDWTQPGVDRQAPLDVWLSFPGEGATPVPLGAAPTSVPFGTSADGAAPNAPAAGAPTSVPVRPSTDGAAANGPLPTTGGSPLGLASLAVFALAALASRRRDRD